MVSSTRIGGFESEDDALMNILSSIKAYCLRQMRLPINIIMIKQTDGLAKTHVIDLLNCISNLKQKQEEGNDLHKIIITNANWNIDVHNTETMVTNRQNRYYICWPLLDFQIIIESDGIVCFHGNRQNMLNVFPAVR